MALGMARLEPCRPGGKSKRALAAEVPEIACARFDRMTLMLVVCLAAIIGCTRNPASTTAPFPASNEVPGWTRTSDIRRFEAADMWKYIDGEAERYLKAGAQRVSTVDYKFQNRVDAVVDIYTMGNSEGAAKILESEPVGDAKSVQLGDSARLYGQSLILRKGPNLVRIVAYEGSADIPQALLELGRNIAARMR